MDGIVHGLIDLGFVGWVELKPCVAHGVAHVVGVVLQAILGLNLPLVGLIIGLVFLRFLHCSQIIMKVRIQAQKMEESPGQVGNTSGYACL